MLDIDIPIHYRSHVLLTILCFLLCSLVTQSSAESANAFSCDQLQIGQYRCRQPVIDPNTQQPVDCNRDNKASVVCFLASDITCVSAVNGTFNRTIGCKFTSGKSYKIALVLSIFFGWLGFDRFYLGYVAIGLFKLFTFGFMFIFHLIDVVLIALQIVTPADGTGYVIDYYGPRVAYVAFTNNTFILPPDL